MKNKYIYRAKISENKFQRLLRLFCLDLTATQIAGATGINRNTVNRYMTEIRRRISEYCRKEDAEEIPKAHEMCFLDSIEKGESSNGLTRLIGIAKNNGKISCHIIPEKKMAQLQYSNASRENGNRYRFVGEGEYYAGLIDLKRMKYFKLKSGGNETHRNGGGIDICEGFWGIARGRLQRFRGLKTSTLPLHIRECEFRYNHSQKELYPLLLRIIREQPLFN